MPVENKGNLVTRRAFVERNGVKLRRVDVLAAVTFKAGSTAYQYTEDLPPFGNGRKSHLYVVCELIERLFEEEAGEGGETSAAREMAEYPLLFYRQLTGAPSVAGADARRMLSFILRGASDANYRLGSRALDELSLDELRELQRTVMEISTKASELATVIDEQVAAAERGFAPPVQGERLAKNGGAR